MKIFNVYPKSDKSAPYTKITAKERKYNNLSVESVDRVVTDKNRSLAVPKVSKVTNYLLVSVLPLPDNISSSTGQEWVVGEMSPFDILLGKSVGSWLSDNGFDRAAIANVVADLGMDMTSIFNSVQNAFEFDFLDKAAQANGIAFNQYKEMLYKGPEFRTFTFRWQFMFKTKKQADRVLELIDELHLLSIPDTTASAYSPYVLPATFNIEFKNTRLPKLESLVVSSIDVDNTAAGMPKFFHDGTPSYIDMSIQFVELNRPVKKTYKKYGQSQ